MKKKKLFLMLVLVPLFVVSLAGCTESTEDTTEPDIEETSESATADGADYDMDEEVDKAAKAYYGDGTEEYNQYSEWHEDHPVGNSYN